MAGIVEWEVDDELPPSVTRQQCGVGETPLVPHIAEHDIYRALLPSPHMGEGVVTAEGSAWSRPDVFGDQPGSSDFRVR
ncbi:hypothetical protein GCM10010528_22850 [Gordonia defluvii]|uniref:Uncharacterized protein n=1 Tax=Gordonia defluvii TaxID=283718 RepID=A0ABP6LHQ1_9ACTN